jgi:hypothetical protein
VLYIVGVDAGVGMWILSPAGNRSDITDHNCCECSRGCELRRFFCTAFIACPKPLMSRGFKSTLSAPHCIKCTMSDGSPDKNKGKGGEVSGPNDVRSQVN